MSYNTDFICTYKQMDDEFSQDYLYRVQLLQAFGLDDWDDDKVNIIMNETYCKIKDVALFIEIIEKAKQNSEISNLISLICDDIAYSELNDESNKDKLVFELLFKYEFFDIMHKCISEQLRNGSVKESTKNMILYLL
jgi:hypothetical protein